MKIALYWFRRDLRLHDNAALHAAAKAFEVVIPVFCLDPTFFKATTMSARQVAFMLKCLEKLEQNIAAAGGKLIICRGEEKEEMGRLLKTTRATALYYNRKYDPVARQRDEAMDRSVKSLGVEVCTFKDDVIFEPDEVLKGDGKPYSVFTPYKNVWRTKSRPEILGPVKFRRPAHFKEPKSAPLPSLRQLGFAGEIPMIPAGEAEAQSQLARFVKEDLFHYGSRRDFPAAHGTSTLSPHLRFGTLSPRTILGAVDRAVKRRPAARKEAETYVGEIIWRDFYRQVLWHSPHVAESCFKPQYNDLKWENNERLFSAWCEGRTGYPIVDAGMRQLQSTGWMHNRVRMIVATFLTKDLLVSWQWGERYFMEKLFDGDQASNNGGWQWSASTGTDAQPYFRIFNPTSQARKFDPEGNYIHRYVPEVESRDYPAPIVDHAKQRGKALALFARARGRA